MKEQVQQIVEELLRLMPCEASVEVFANPDDTLLVHISSPEAARLIGKDARMLDALQLLVNRMALKRDDSAPLTIVDVERYRERQKDRLLSRALSAAEQVERSGCPITLPPMNSTERRTVHQALKQREDLRTRSVETDIPGIKQVVIEPAAPNPGTNGPP